MPLSRAKEVKGSIWTNMRITIKTENV